MRKPVVALAASAGVFTVVAAGAASLNVVGYVPQWGMTGTSCQAHDLTVTPIVQPVSYPANPGQGVLPQVYQVLSKVVISNIDAACIGQELGVGVITTDTGSYAVNHTATVTGASLTVDLDPYYYGVDLDAEYVSSIDVTIAGDVVTTFASLI